MPEAGMGHCQPGAERLPGLLLAGFVLPAPSLAPRPPSQAWRAWKSCFLSVDRPAQGSVSIEKSQSQRASLPGPGWNEARLPADPDSSWSGKGH